MKRLVWLAVVVVSAGCAPMLTVKTLQPAQTSCGGLTHLSLVQVEGRAGAKEAIAAELISQARAAGYFVVTDRTGEGLVVTVKGKTASMAGGTQPQAEDELAARVDVIDWKATKDSKTAGDSKGTEMMSTVWMAKVVLRVTLFTAKGNAPVAEKELTGNLTGQTEEAAINASVKRAVAVLLEQITPTWVEKEVKMDTDDEEQKAIVDRVRKHELKEAIADEKAVVLKNPKNAGALFNLAVMLDAEGEYEAGLGYYDQAIKVDPRPYYGAGRSECARRAELSK